MSKRLLMNNVKKATVITYNITYELTEVTLDNNITSIEEGQSYTANVIVADGYEISHIMILIGVTDITDTCYADGVINIDSVISDIEITIVAKEVKQTSYYNRYVFTTPNANYTISLKADRRGDTTEWDGLTDWGDGTVDTATSHTYANPGTYEVVTKWVLNKGGDSSSYYSSSTARYLTACNGLNSNMTDVSYMFYSCRSLTSVDLSNFDTSNVTNMRRMFYSCEKLTSLDISNWNTSNVTNMNNMFYTCRVLTEIIGIESRDTSNVTNMSDMFGYCAKLISLDLSSWNVAKVTGMDSMFSGCSSLTSLNINNWQPPSNCSCHYFVQGCSLLTNFSKNNISSVLSTAIDKCNYGNG